MIDIITKFRPSSLDKLAECPRYLSEEKAGKYASRGNALDVVFRARISGETCDESALSEDERAALSWAVDAARIIAKGLPLEARESELKIKCEGMEGTADLLCPQGDWHADLKTGLIRSYRVQQAAYALGFMDRFFMDSWSCFIIYCYERITKRYDYTREDAERLIRGVKAAALDELSRPTPCEYCGWCARKYKCPERLETVAWFLGLDPADVDLTEHADDPVKLGQSLALTYEIQKDSGGVHGYLKERAVELLVTGKTLDGWKLQNGRKSESVAALAIQHAYFGGKSILDLVGQQGVFSALGTLTLAKFSPLWNQAYEGKDIPDGVVKESNGAAFLVKNKSKKLK